MEIIHETAFLFHHLFKHFYIFTNLVGTARLSLVTGDT